MATDPQIENPLSNRGPGDLLGDVEIFHQDQELGKVIDLITLQKGALIARDPGDPLLSEQDSNGHAKPLALTPAERSALDGERHSSWYSQTRELRMTILVTACAAITQGWQQSTINASSTALCSQFNLGKNSLRLGLINAAPWLSGSIVGTLLSDPLQESIFGRLPVLGIAAIFCIVCVIGTAEANTWQEVLICRLLLGIGVKIGTKASVAPVFAAEAAPDKHRGRILMMWQLFDALGIFLGFVCALLVRGSWRVLLASAMIPPTALLFLVLVCPESPRFYIRRVRYVDAYKSLRQLRGTDIQAARDLYYIHSQLQAETNLFVETDPGAMYETLVFQNWINDTGPFERMRYLFSKPRSRRACIVAFIVMAVQQLCGINVLAFYSFLLFNPEQTTTSTPNWKTNWFNFGFGLANVTFTLLAYPFIDSRGRRPLMLVSLGGTTVSLFMISGLFWVPNDGTRAILVAVFTIVIFTFFYSVGAGPIPFTLSAEVFPLCLREVGMSFSVMVNFLGLGLLVLFVPKLTHVLDDEKPNASHAPSYILIFFSVLNVVAFVLVFLLVPETNNESLEGMKTIFAGESTKERALRHIHSVRSSANPEERNGVPMQRVPRPDEEG